MRNLVIVAMLLLAGCASMHEPKLAKPPNDMAKYEADKAACRAEAKDRQRASIKKHQTPLMAFGLIGAAVSNEMTRTNPEDDYYKTHMEMTDECLAARGYKIAK